MHFPGFKQLSTTGLFLAIVTGATVSRAEVPVTTTVRYVPGSNGHGALMLDLESKRLVHFREHLFASEEPLLDEAGAERWNGNQPLSVPTRDLLYDAYFGLRVDGKQSWMTSDPADLGRSGYVEFKSGARGGTGVIRLAQTRGSLELTQYAFMPRSLPHAGFVMAVSVRNLGATPASSVSVFSLHNFHLGFGRPGPREELSENGETAFRLGTSDDVSERGFAGVVVAKPLAAPTRRAASHVAAPAGDNLFAIVDSGSGDFPDFSGEAPVRDGTITGFQWDLGALAAGEERWIGVAFAHHGDPFAAAEAQGWLDSFVKNRNAQELVTDELGEWSELQASLVVPNDLAPEETDLYRHGAAMLAMAQVRESETYVREWLSKDGEPRRTRFGATPNAPPASLPAKVVHRGRGGVLASLPPGEWTVSWLRDGAYALAAMARMGLTDGARDGLAYFLDAEGGRFQAWQELADYGFPPYQLSLVRYHGFGVEETDFNGFGPNLEFDGFGLFLWALRTYQLASQDDAFVAERWDAVRTLVADALVALVDPNNGLIRADSSIWETHWNGRQRQWGYTSITAARGLCDAAAIADSLGDEASATKYRAAGNAIRAAIASKLTDPDGAIASNLEELGAGEGYWDAAVLDAIALELFDPNGRIAKATMAGIEARLRAPAGAGWSRNDDRTDHAGGEDLSPWGSEYDSGEWVFVDLRGSVAAALMGDESRARRLTDWVGSQAAANYLETAEVFDEIKGTYKFNSPMIGFGPGAYALALQQRTRDADPACGAYFDEPVSSGGGASPSSGNGDGFDGSVDESGCGCRMVSSDSDLVVPVGLAGLLFLARRRRR